MSTRIPALDGLRGIAILLVMTYHQTVGLGDVAVDRALAFVTSAGWIGVDLFFVLSGFLITGILLDAKGSQHYFRNFYARRTLRIFPLYFAVVGFSLLVLPHIPHWKAENLGRIAGDEWFYWTYLSNVSIALHGAFRHGVLDISWSLAIEEQFYLVWPLVVLLLSPRRLVQVCLGLIVLAMAWRAAAVVTGLAPIAIYVLTPSRVDALAVGALIAMAFRSGRGLDRLEPSARAAALGSATLLLAIALASGGFDPFSPTMQIVGYTALAVLFGAMLLLTLTAGSHTIGRRLLEQPVLIAFGTYSYALYLFHLPIRAVIRDRIYGPDQFLNLGGSTLPGQLLFYVVATAAAFVAAWLSWHVFERHFLALKRYFAGRDDTLAQPAVVWPRRPSVAVLQSRRRTEA